MKIYVRSKILEDVFKIILFENWKILRRIFFKKCDFKLSDQKDFLEIKIVFKDLKAFLEKMSF